MEFRRTIQLPCVLETRTEVLKTLAVLLFSPDRKKEQTLVCTCREPTQNTRIQLLPFFIGLSDSRVYRLGFRCINLNGFLRAAVAMPGEGKTRNESADWHNLENGITMRQLIFTELLFCINYTKKRAHFF